MTTPDMTHTLLTLGDATFLVSPWKPFLILLVFLPWAWIVSKIYDKHAARFHLAREMWNLVHLIAGVLAVAAALFAGIPVGGEAAIWVGLLAMIVILAADLFAYAIVANKDERVPERYHIKLDIAAKLAEAREAKHAEKVQATVELTIKNPKGETVKAPEKEMPEYEIRLAAEEVYQKAMKARASQVDIAPASRETYALSMLVDGVRQPPETLPAPNAIKIMDFWKGAAGLDVNDRRRKQTASVKVTQDEITHEARISSIGRSAGMSMTMLFDPAEATRRDINDIGLLETQTAELKAIVDDGTGVVLLAAPTDNGRTTTLYAIGRMHDAYTSNVQTLELEPDAALEGVRANIFDPTVGGEFSTTLRSILRRDPDVVLVAEVPDAETVKEAVKSDQERTRIYLSMRADNALAAVQSFVAASGDAAKAGDALRGVMAQRLLRKLCVNCRAPYTPSPDVLKKLGVPEGKVERLFKRGGQVLIKNKPEVCPVCDGAGYLGQTAIVEVFRITPEDRALISQGNLQALRAEFRKRQLPTMQQAAIRKAVDGTTSVEEILRVTTAQSKPKAGAKPAPEKPTAGTGVGG